MLLVNSVFALIPRYATLNSMHADTFQQLVNDAVDHIPAHYRDRMGQVAIVVADEPTEHQRQKLNLRPCQALYGLYEGVPLPERGGVLLQREPDIITIFMHPMVDHFTDIARLREQVYETVWHEVGHYFGLNHTQLDAAKRTTD